jgi:hypothetical protein
MVEGHGFESRQVAKALVAQRIEHDKAEMFVRLEPVTARKR